MISRFFQQLFHLFLYVLVFVGLAWFLLGISPQETWIRSKTNVLALMGKTQRFSANMRQTAGDMKEAADAQLQSASDRLKGIDPYEKVAARFDADIQGNK